MKTVDAARGRWPGILRALGLDERFLRNRHTECPMCGGRDRYRFDDKDGAGTYFCNTCGAGDGFKLAMGITGMTFVEVARAIDEIVHNVEVTPVRVAPDPLPRLRALAKSLAPMDSINPVRLYLKARGLAPAPSTQYCKSLAYYAGGQLIGYYPAMVHLLRDAAGRPVTYHVTYLTEAGAKAPVEAPRKVLPGTGPLAGCAIQLWPAGSTLGIAEGVETAMAAQARFGFPVWAAYSATLLEQWRPPAGVDRVCIFADNDHSFTGQKAAYSLAHRLTREGMPCWVEMPSDPGTDFADEAGHAE